LVAPVFHAFTTTYPAVLAHYQRDGINHVMLTQWAASSANLRPPIPAAKCKYPVTFVGTAHGKRKNWIADLNQQGIKVDCFGYGWERGSISAAEIPDIIQNSVISLNFANGAFAWNGLRPGTINQIKARTFEVPGAGGFLLTESAEGLDRYYRPDHEVVVFSNLEELASKIRYYQDHQELRDTIARAGYDRTCAEHTYDKRLSKVIDYAIDMASQYYSQLGRIPSHQIDWLAFERVQQSHKMGWELRTLRNINTRLCSLIWGKKRGVRAARRLVFEFSWRLAGKQTYSASGWPGRMYYDAS
jgi:spore maturation protein CgeB